MAEMIGNGCCCFSCIAYTLCSTADGMEASRGRAMCNIVSLIEEEIMTMNYFVVVIK